MTVYYRAPLPAGEVHPISNVNRLSRNEGGVRIEVRAMADGNVQIFYQDISPEFLVLKPGERFFFDVGVDQTKAHDVVFSTAGYVVRPDGEET